jgi:hypothetical protein
MLTLAKTVKQLKPPRQKRQKAASRLSPASGIPSIPKLGMPAMANALLGLGIDGHQPRKLNLKNVNLDLIFEIDFENAICCYKSGAGRHFALASNSIEYLTPAAFFSRRKKIKAVINTHFKGKESKEFIRGKYELWFFVKFIQKISAKLSSKKEAKLTGFKRATPRTQISYETAVEVLAPRLGCPDRLATFLNDFFNDISRHNNVASFVLSQE